jgi:hypothetical protein
MLSEWSPGEDLRPGTRLLRNQPEKSARGLVWTQITWFELDGAKAYTQLTIREVSGDYLLGHGRIWPVADEDGA